MQSKRALGKDLEELPAEKRFRSNLADVFLSGSVTARRSQTLFSDAQLAGTQHVEDLAKVRGGSESSNTHRDLMRKLLKGSLWPKPYEAPIRCFDPKTQKDTIQWLPFMLPSELLAQLVKHGDISMLLCQDGMDGKAKAHVRNCERELGLPENTLVALGLWVDGVACGWDRSQSLEVASVHLPGLPAPFKNLRFLHENTLQKQHIQNKRTKTK